MSLPEAKIPLSGPVKLEFARSISYIFENPNWLMDALWCFICQLVASVIPVLPQMVVFGYQFEMLDSLLASRGTRYPDFNPNRLVDYLGRGVWPILAMLIVAVVWMPLFIVFVLISVGVVAALNAAGGKDVGPVLAFFGIVAAVLVGLLLVLVLVLLTTPVILRAGIAQDFGAAFDFGWISDFLKKMWVEIVLASLFIGVCSIGITLLTCGIGGIFVGAIAPFVHSHFWYQFYVLYLARGGTPVTPKAIAYAVPQTLQ
jgi:hypothetical protein